LNFLLQEYIMGICWKDERMVSQKKDLNCGLSVKWTLRDQKDILAKKDFNMNRTEQRIRSHPWNYCDGSNIERKYFPRHKESSSPNWKIPELNAGANYPEKVNLWF
jgi:hypothetical protein